MANVSSSNGLEKRPKLRFPGFDDPWKETTLSALFSKSTQKNADGHITNVICNSAKLGLIPQREYFDKDIANSDNTSGYYIIRQNDFVYNPRKSSDAPYGPISSYKYAEDGIVSPLYLCFHAKGEINPLYYEWYFRSSAWHRYIYMSGDSGARHDRVSIKDDTFFAMPINLPSEQEQSKIASFLQSLDERIAAQEKLVASLKKYKRGLSKAVFSTNSELFPKSTVASLGELFPFIRNGFVGTVTPFFTSQENGVRYLQGTNIHDGKISDETAFYVTQAFNQKHSKNILKSNDILVVQSGHVGECAVVGDNYAGSNCHALIIMSNGGECASDYICQYINSDDGKKKIAAITTGNTIKHILATSIANIEVPLPSKKDQQRIAELLNSWDNRIEQEICNLCKLVRIKEGLLQQLFI